MIFHDRITAGRALAKRVNYLGIPLDVIVVRKLGCHSNPNFPWAQ
jgi:predicted phosphoribosyltransferase